jgi:hypothetical protein
MSLVHDDSEEVVDDNEAQEMIQRTVKKFGRFILGCDAKPRIGDIEEFAGLPLRAVKFVTEAEALREHDPATWGDWVSYKYYFEVEVAD